MHTICIDFGTSSIRAAVRKERNVLPHPLAIASKSVIDNASIPSAIFISKAGDEVLFGVKALESGLSGKPSLLFETSPKAWLSPKNIGELDSPPVAGLAFSRRQLVAGLLSLSVRAARRAAEKAFELAPDTLAYRFSHPVWEKSQRSRMNSEYDALRRIACASVGGQVKYVMTGEEFAHWCAKAVPDSGLPAADVEVEEPVAATLELFPDPPLNRRSAALVVDVGAGTIDLGLFASVMPDKGSKVKHKLIPMASPRSLFGAGDEIDRTLIKLVIHKLGGGNDAQLARLKNDIRSFKERLFDSGNLVYDQIEVSVAELIAMPELKAMAAGLRRAMDDMFSEAGARFKTELTASVHRLDHLDVVFAGGGAKLGFLRALVGSIESMDGNKLTVRQVEAEKPPNFEVEASLARMAVALGGATPERDWPKTEMDVAVIHALSAPLPAR